MPQEIVIVAGPPGGGKSTAIQPLVDAGYTRINRDELGGSLRPGGIAYTALRAAYDGGARTFVLDNIYATVDSRLTVLQLGRDLGLPVRCLWMNTTPEQAQFFAARRQVQRYGKVLRPEDYKQLPYKKDPNMFPPAAQFAYWKRVERPSTAEGFQSVDFVPVVVTLGAEYINKAVIFDFDGTLRVAKSGAHYPATIDDIVILPGRTDRLQALKNQGWLLLGASNQSGCSKAPGDPKYVSEEDARICFKTTCDKMSVGMDVVFATEAGGVPQSYLRKPCPGMGIHFIEKYKLDPKLCIYVGDLGTDATFARRCGFQFQEATKFFEV